MTKHLVQLKFVQDHLPVSMASIYSQKSRGNWTWVTRSGPHGRRGRRLWVDVEALRAWIQKKGWKVTLPDTLVPKR